MIALSILCHMTLEESNLSAAGFGEVVRVTAPERASAVLVVCEHASNRIPSHLGALGLSADLLENHIAWDPGALPVAKGIAQRLSAGLVSGGVSRLVYDCNRPPEAPSAIPARSEVHDVPGNAGLATLDRQRRIDGVYHPFHLALGNEIKRQGGMLRLMLTIHSFTPVYQGQTRQVEIGVLHGRDARFALAMMAHLPDGTAFETRLNEPYSAADGVAHTLDKQGDANGLLNVMIEVRNDLITTEAQQEEMAEYLAGWISRTLDHLDTVGGTA